MTREDYEARIDEDDGDPAATVWVLGTSGHNYQCYHADRECHRIESGTRDPTAWTRERAQRHGRIPCRFCVETVADPPQASMPDTPTFAQRCLWGEEGDS